MKASIKESEGVKLIYLTAETDEDSSTLLNWFPEHQDVAIGFNFDDIDRSAPSSVIIALKNESIRGVNVDLKTPPTPPPPEKPTPPRANEPVDSEGNWKDWFTAAVLTFSILYLAYYILLIF